MNPELHYVLELFFIENDMIRAKRFRLREQLRQEWSADQERQKSEDMNIAFSYWDGSGHRRDTQMKKGSSIGQFLAKALEILRKVIYSLLLQFCIEMDRYLL